MPLLLLRTILRGKSVCFLNLANDQTCNGSTYIGTLANANSAHFYTTTDGGVVIQTTNGRGGCLSILFQHRSETT